jgi:aryl carrier-like protein
LDEAELRRFLFSRLSGFKVPSQILLVDAIPRGATGKVQRTTLHGSLASLLRRPFVEPCTELQRSVAETFREVLECGPLGLDDNFFAMGGDSLKGARVIARLNVQQGLDLPVIALFSHPTVAKIAELVELALAERSSEDAALVSEIEALSDDEVERLLGEGKHAA